jgi:hydrogenase maturation protease
MTRILILALGNILLQDEGAGMRAIQELQERYLLPEGIQVLDGGVCGLALLPYLTDISRLLIVDTVQADEHPGALIRLTGDAIPLSIGLKLSPHQDGLTDLLWAAQALGCCPQEIVFWGIQPASTEIGLSLTSEIEGQIPLLVEHLAHELRGWGVSLAFR